MSGCLRGIQANLHFIGPVAALVVLGLSINLLPWYITLLLVAVAAGGIVHLYSRSGAVKEERAVKSKAAHEDLLAEEIRKEEERSRAQQRKQARQEQRRLERIKKEKAARRKAEEEARKKAKKEAKKARKLAEQRGEDPEPAAAAAAAAVYVPPAEMESDSDSDDDLLRLAQIQKSGSRQRRV